MSASIHYLYSAPRAVTGAEPARLLPDLLCCFIELAIAEALVELHIEKLEAHCIRAKQLIDLAAWDRAYADAYPRDFAWGGDAA